MDYKGYIEVQLDDNKLAVFYNNKNLYAELYELKENEYLLIKDSSEQVVDKYCYQNGELRQVKWKPIISKTLGKIKPLNIYQELGFHMLQSVNSTVKVFNSDYGVGKTFLCINYIFENLEKGRFDKIILIRPNIGLEDYPSLGAVPGDFKQKLMPWFAMIGDIAGSAEYIQQMVDDGQIELAPLETIRGRSFKNCAILVEECGNLTTAACRLIISRCGEGSVLFMCGDESQADKKRFREDSGLKNMIEGLKGNPLFSTIKLKGCVRSETAQLCELF